MKNRLLSALAATALALSVAAPAADASVPYTTDVGTVITSGNVGSESAVVITDDDLAVIAVLDDSDDTISVVTCADPLCEDGERFDIASGIADADVDIALAPDGTPVIAYSYVTNLGAFGGVRVVTCGNATCSQHVATSELAWHQWGGFGAVSVAVRADSTPVVSYTGIAGWVMGYRVVSCNDSACAGGGETSTWVDFSYGGVAGDLALDGGDRPVVVVGRYVDNSARLFRCQNHHCTSSTTEAIAGELRSPKIAASGTEVAIVGTDGPGRVNMARCTTSCDSAKPISSSGHSGRAPDVTFIDAGVPAAVYYESANRLWFVSCPTECSSAQYVTRDAGPFRLGLSISGDGDEAYVSYYQRSRANLGIVHVHRPKKPGFGF